MKKSNRKKYKRRRRAALLVLAAAFVFAFCADADKSSETYTVVVSNGDTLWEIANEANTCSMDVRRIVDDIIELNNISSANIHAGDRLIVPVY